MPKFLIKAAYTADGAKGLLKDGGTKRKETIEKLISAVGGKVESFYYSANELNALVIIDLPDITTATALSLTINASGLVTVSATQLLSPAELDAATAMSISYRAPGT